MCPAGSSARVDVLTDVSVDARRLRLPCTEATIFKASALGGPFPPRRSDMGSDLYGRGRSLPQGSLESSRREIPVASISRFVLAHKRLVVVFWAAVTVVAFAAIQPAGDALNQQFTVPGREGFETNRQIQAIYGTGGSDVTPIVPVVTLPRGTTVHSPGIRTQLAAAVEKVQTALPEARVASHASTGDRAFVSRDGRTTFALVYIPSRGGLEPGQKEAQAAQAALDGVTVGGSPVRVTGLDALRASAAGDEAGGSVTLLVEVIVAAVGALVVLAFVFASFMALVPLLMAIVAIPTTFLLVWPLAAITDVSVVIQFLVALVGLGIAIDYALLIVVRWREERRREGTTNEQAVLRAMEHAGCSVVFSGTTVAIGLLALVALPVPFLRSIGIAGMLIPLVSVAVAITLLPVILATLGPRLDWPRSRRVDRGSRAWTGWARLVVRNRWAAALASTAVLVALVVAATTIQLGAPRAESLAQTGTARAALADLERAGIGSGPLTPYEALVRSGDPDAVARTLAGVEGVRAAVAPADWRRDGSALVTVIPTVDGNSSAGHATLDRVRAAAGDLEADVVTGGQVAQTADFVDAVYSNFPLMIALIAILTFLLLARAFRSLVLPLKAVLLNVLSVAAAWGVMVLVWQKGIGSDSIWGSRRPARSTPRCRSPSSPSSSGSRRCRFRIFPSNGRLRPWQAPESRFPAAGVRPERLGIQAVGVGGSLGYATRNALQVQSDKGRSADAKSPKGAGFGLVSWWASHCGLTQER
jgi:putative drug exporter of the RND superfamily